MVITMPGKLIVIEGADGSGKSTQFLLLRKYIEEMGKPFKTLQFPRYSEPSSALIKMYLNGEFGTNPSDVNAYAASAFYAVDRYASYKQDWGTWYKSGGLIISDRYTTSNAVHQTAKVPESEREAFLDWLYDFEHKKLALPEPDLVIYLDVPADYANAMLRKREADTNTTADIHEKDTEYLAKCREIGRLAAKQYGWHSIQCVVNQKMRSIDDIHAEIASIVSKYI